MYGALEAPDREIIISGCSSHSAVRTGLPYLFGGVDQPLGPFRQSKCKYCNERLIFENLMTKGPGNAPQRVDVLSCDRCLWWMMTWAKVIWGDVNIDLRVVVHEAAVHSFDYQVADQPLMALRQELARHESDLRDLSPKTLELLVGSVFRDFFDAEVEHIGRSGDGGIDLLLVRSSSPIAVQVKRRANRTTESPAVVRELLGAMVLSDLRRGIVVTTADHFGSASLAMAEPQMRARTGYSIDLYAMDQLLEVLRLVEPLKRPWVDYAFSHHLSPSDRALKQTRDVDGPAS